MIGEQKYIEDQNAIAFKQYQKDYGFEQTPSQKINAEKSELKKRLREINAEENKTDPKLIEKGKRKLHHAVQQHKKQKELSNKIIKQNVEQDTHITAEGMLVYGR